jgi:hypothetical protein
LYWASPGAAYASPSWNWPFLAAPGALAQQKQQHVSSDSSRHAAPMHDRMKKTAFCDQNVFQHDPESASEFSLWWRWYGGTVVCVGVGV